jgi:hypothetical protein
LEVNIGIRATRIQSSPGSEGEGYSQSEFRSKKIRRFVVGRMKQEEIEQVVISLLDIQAKVC